MPVPPCRVVVLSVVAAFAVAAGCGGDSASGGKDAERQARTVVERFGAAAARHDYQTICDDLLADALLKSVESVGLPCEIALQKGLGDVRDPRIAVRQVRVQGARALVSVHSTAAGQPPSDDAVQLVREGGEWRIASLVSPQARRRTRPSTTSVPTPDHRDRDAAARAKRRRGR